MKAKPNPVRPVILSNFLKIFKETLDKNPKINKVGFSLTIKDIPDSNLDKDIIIDWEKKYWKYNDKNGKP